MFPHYVWYDLDCNGCQDAGEPGVDGLEVWLDDYLLSPPILGSVITSNGFYALQIPYADPFETYYVRYTEPGYYPTIINSPQCDSSLDSDFQYNDFYYWGEYEFELDVNIYSDTIDAGLVLYNCHLGDYVWQDDDRDGIQDPEEDGLANVEVILSNSKDYKDSCFTDADGLYLFTDLFPGEYTLEFVLPVNYAFSPQNQGSDDSLDSDPDPITGIVADISLHPCDNNINTDAGMYLNDVPTLSAGTIILLILVLGLFLANSLNKSITAASHRRLRCRFQL